MLGNLNCRKLQAIRSCSSMQGYGMSSFQWHDDKCTLMRCTTRDESTYLICLLHAQTRAVALLSRAAEWCDDDTRLQRVVPYLLVRCNNFYCKPCKLAIGKEGYHSQIPVSTSNSM